MTDSLGQAKTPQVGQQEPADYDTLARLLYTTREKLASYVIGNTELETLLGIERDKNAKLQAQLDAIQSKDTPPGSK